jgi:hypothetical protein
VIWYWIVLIPSIPEPAMIVNQELRVNSEGISVEGDSGLELGSSTVDIR